MNGSALVDDIVIVTEQAQLKPVEGGIDEPIPRVLGFTIGVALGLEARRVPETSLLALGTTGTDLSAGDIDRARRVAKTVTGVMTIDETQKAAAAAQAAG
jgi:enoyl-CoA hydratase/carnithine racemase